MRTSATLSESAGQLSARLGQLLARYESGEDVFAGDMGETGQESLYPLTDPAVSYPALLYDGPFSDAAGQTEYRALAGLPDVDAAGAERALRAYSRRGGGDRAAPGGREQHPRGLLRVFRYGEWLLHVRGRYEGGRAGALHAAQRGRDGGRRSPTSRRVEAARAFLAARGYGEMHESYFSRYDGILTVNFAAVQDDVVLYPDLVKVQVSLRDGAVIGHGGGRLSAQPRRARTRRCPRSRRRRPSPASADG